jgi:hypothetical protein
MQGRVSKRPEHQRYQKAIIPLISRNGTSGTADMAVDFTDTRTFTHYRFLLEEVAAKRRLKFHHWAPAERPFKTNLFPLN